jgi:hypothetical protein
LEPTSLREVAASFADRPPRFTSRLVLWDNVRRIPP